MKTIKYIITNNFKTMNVSKLSLQLKLLVDLINSELEFSLDNKTFIRDNIQSEFLAQTNSTDNVFSSHIHSLIQFDFIDRVDVKPKVELTLEQIKSNALKAMKSFTREELLAMINQD